MARGRTTNTSWCFASAPTARLRGRDAGSAWCRPCHNRHTSATSSAITAVDKPVTLRSLMIAARDTPPHDITMIDDQEFDVSCTSSVDG